jgi:TldD protein
MPEILATETVSGVLREGLHAGAEWVEVFAEDRVNQTVKLDGDSITEVRSDRDAGVGVRAIAAGRTGFAFTNALTRPSLLETARAAATAARATAPLEAGRDPEPLDLRAATAPATQRARYLPTEQTPGDIAHLLRRVASGAREVGGDVDTVSATHVAVAQDVMVASSTGQLISDTRIRTRVTCRVTARRLGRLEAGFSGPGGGTGMEYYADEQAPEVIGRQAAERALRSLDGAEPPSGVLPVVLGSAGGGLLLHEACAHGLEGDGLSRGTSLFATTAGQQVGSRLVSAVDDPALDGAYGSYGADDEGILSSSTTLLAEGVQVGALTDTATARLLDTSSSGNGRRQSYAHPPLPRMSNTYILPGVDNRDALIGAVERGVYVVGLKGGDVDTTTGRFAFAASEAYLIEHGQVTQPLVGLTLLGDGPSVLASVEAVADDLALTQALCGKEGQWVPVSYGSPTLLVGHLTVAGHQ